MSESPCTCTTRMIQTPSGATQARLRDPKCPEHGRKQASFMVSNMVNSCKGRSGTFLAQMASAAIDDFWLKQAGYVY